MIEIYKQKWLELLRSGHYGKGTRFLRKSADFCAMGLAYEALCKTHKLQYSWYNQPLNLFTTEPEGNPCTLNTELLDVMGLTEQQQRDIISKSDGGWSFEDIATWIEQNF